MLGQFEENDEEDSYVKKKVCNTLLLTFCGVNKKQQHSSTIQADKKADPNISEKVCAEVVFF